MKTATTKIALLIIVIGLMALILGAANPIQAKPPSCNPARGDCLQVIPVTAGVFIARQDPPRSNPAPGSGNCGHKQCKATPTPTATATLMPTATNGATCHWYAPPCPTGQYCAAIVQGVCN